MLPGDYQFYIQKHGFKLDKVAFYAWLETGTLAKATKRLALDGIINRRKKEPYSTMGVLLAARRYMVENHEEVKPVLLEHWKEYGVEYVSDEDWDKYILQIAIQVLGNSSKKRFMDWLALNPEFEKYEYMYAIRFGIEADRRTEI